MSLSLPGFELQSAAIFSRCRTWRYSLVRQWDPTVQTVVFVGLNPSTADETVDDPTIRRCIRFAREWGYGGLVMCNLFAYRATDPKDMKAAEDPVGPENDDYLRSCAQRAGLVVAAWGAHGGHLGRAQQVVDAGLLGNFTVLGLTKDGHPRHPLYMRADCRPLNPITLASAA
jgi:hypothetical protein